MPLTGRQNFQSTPLVFDVPALPYPLYKGEISYSDRMTGEPTAAIAYEGISSKEIGKLEAAYPLGSDVVLYGVPMQVANVSYQEDGVVVKGAGRLVVYTVDVSLAFKSIVLQAKEKFGSGATTNPAAVQPSSNSSGSTPRWQKKLEELGDEADVKGFIAFSDGLRVKELGKGAQWRFTPEQIVEVGGNSVAYPTEGYNKATLTWGDEDDQQGRTAFSPKKPKIVTLIEGDPDLTIPPDDDVTLGTKVGEDEDFTGEAKGLKDGSSNFDQSGPTKFQRTVTTLDGTGEKELYQLYGYAYRYQDIYDADGYPTGASPANFWRLVEEKTTQYIYQRLGDYANLEVDIRDNGDLLPSGEGKSIRFVVHPDYEEFLKSPIVGGGKRLTVKSTTQYLVEVKTRGRKLTRLVQESDSRNTLDAEDPYTVEGLFDLEWQPIDERQVYLLRPARGTFVPDTEQLPFRVEFQDYDALEDRIKALVGPSSTTADNKVAILYPDPQYTEPFYVAEEATQSNSFRSILDPDLEPEDPPRYFTTGEESDNRVRRTPTDPENGFYTEVQRQYRAQDPSFVAVAEQTTFKEMRGSPPSPSTRQIAFEPETIRPRGPSRDTDRTHLVTTPDNADRFPEGGSVNIPGAKSLREAQEAVRVRLRRSGLQGAQAQYTVAWFYPTMKPGDSVIIEGDRHGGEGTWLVDQLSWKLKFDANNVRDLGRPTVTCDGMSLSLGMDKARQVQFTSKPKAANGGSPTIAGKVSDAPNQSLGRVLPPLINRRSY